MNAPPTIRSIKHAPVLDFFLGVLARAGALDRPGNEFQLAQGRFSAVVPSDASSEKLEHFNVGALVDGKQGSGDLRVRVVPDTIPAIAALVVECTQGLADPVLWIHEPLLTEEELPDRWLPTQRVGNQLFLLSKGRDTRQTDRVAESINYSLLSWHFLMFVTNAVSSPASTSDLLEQALMVVVGAYDGEGALLWQRS